MSNELVKCKYCGKEFDKSHIGGHIANCNKNTNLVGEFSCRFCGRKFNKLYGLHRHEKQCNLNPDKVKEIYVVHNNELRDDLFCKFCNKQCKNLNALSQHQIRCKSNPDRYGLNNTSGKPSWNKGLTKETDERVARCTKALIDTIHSPDYIDPRKGRIGNWLGKKHKEETKIKIGKSVSKSRLIGYSNGSITPAKGVGRGKYSYLLYKDNKYMLRSTYEFIYAIYLINLDIDFEFESIRVPAVRENKYGKTFISDFKCGNTIIEIKGIPSGKDYYIKESFENAGYEFKELFVKDILVYKQYLEKQGFNIDELIDKIVCGHNSKNYAVFNADDFKRK